MSDNQKQANTDKLGPTVLCPAGLTLLIGSVGVVIASGFYILSPTATVLPSVPIDIPAAMAGAVHGKTTMFAAGTIGILGDIAISAAAIVLAIYMIVRGRGLTSIGWMLVGFSTLLFILVDSLVGFVLTPAAIASREAFVAAKYLFDTLFLVATFTFGAGAVVALLSHLRRRGVIPRPLAVLAFATGVISLVSGLLGFFGVSVSPQVVGGGIAAGALFFALIGLYIAKNKAI